MLIIEDHLLQDVVVDNCVSRNKVVISPSWLRKEFDNAQTIDLKNHHHHLG